MEIQREETQLNKRFIEAVKKAFGNHVLPLRDIERVNFCLKGSLNDIGNVLKLVWLMGPLMSHFWSMWLILFWYFRKERAILRLLRTSSKYVKVKYEENSCWKCGIAKKAFCLRLEINHTIEQGPVIEIPCPKIDSADEQEVKESCFNGNVKNSSSLLE